MTFAMTSSMVSSMRRSRRAASKHRSYIRCSTSGMNVGLAGVDGDGRPLDEACVQFALYGEMFTCGGWAYACEDVDGEGVAKMK